MHFSFKIFSLFWLVLVWIEKSFLPIGGKEYAFPRSSWFMSSHYSNMWIREPGGENQALVVCMISPFWFLRFVSLSSLDQTDLMNNVTGDDEAMAGGREQGLLRHAIHLNWAPHVRALLTPRSGDTPCLDRSRRNWINWITTGSATGSTGSATGSTGSATGSTGSRK